MINKYESDPWQHLNGSGPKPKAEHHHSTQEAPEPDEDQLHRRDGFLNSLQTSTDWPQDVTLTEAEPEEPLGHFSGPEPKPAVARIVIVGRGMRAYRGHEGATQIVDNAASEYGAQQVFERYESPADGESAWTDTIVFHFISNTTSE